MAALITVQLEPCPFKKRSHCTTMALTLTVFTHTLGTQKHMHTNTHTQRAILLAAELSLVTDTLFLYFLKIFQECYTLRQ